MFGRVGWFGTIHQWQIVRGDQVVVLTDTGRWSGEVLGQQENRSVPHNYVPAGEVVFVYPVASRDSNAAPSTHFAQEHLAAGRLAMLLLNAAHQWLSNQISELHRASPGDLRRHNAQRHFDPSQITILDCEVSLDGDVGVILFLGDAVPALGVAASTLCEQVGLARVQWLSVIDIPRELPHSVPINNEAPSDQQQYWLDLAKGIASNDRTQIERVARQRRLELGLLGTYLQKRRQPHGEPSSIRQWMVRVKATAGGLTKGQFEKLAELAVKFGDGTIRLTMRQGLQLHGVTSQQPRELLRAIHDLALTTQGSCGNTVRNVTCCPFLPTTASAIAARELAGELGRRWLPQSHWLEWLMDPHDAEPSSAHDTAYVDGYLPHKWKIGVATNEHDCVNVRVNDLGLIVRADTDQRCWVDCYVGGSVSYRPDDEQRIASLAAPLGSISREHLEPVVAALMKMHREQITAGPRPSQRLKSLVMAKGISEIADYVQKTVQFRDLFRPCGNLQDLPERQHPRWSKNDHGTWTAAFPIRGGRLRFANDRFANDEKGSEQPLSEWLRLMRLSQRVRIGPQHSIVLEEISQRDRAEVEQIVSQSILSKQIVAESSIACNRVITCVSFPTCPFALGEAERAELAWREAVAQCEIAMRKLLFAIRGVKTDGRPLIVALSGCPHGCSQPLLADVGIVAESTDKYRVFLGGGPTQLAKPLCNVQGPHQLAEMIHQLVI